MIRNGLFNESSHKLLGNKKLFVIWFEDVYRQNKQEVELNHLVFGVQKEV